jgi:hypothetical protein
MASTDTLKPQDWTEVVSPPAELLAAIRELVPAGDGPLTTEQLVRLSAEIAAHTARPRLELAVAVPQGS